MKLNELITLRRASIYQHPGDTGTLLSKAFGDFASAAAVSSDVEAGAMLPGTPINILDWTYQLNDGPSAEVTDIYVEDVRQAPSVYEVNLADNYEGQGVVTTVTFGVDPGGRRIGWRGRGLVDTSGELISNPIAALRHYFLTTGSTPWDRNYFDAGTSSEAEVYAENQGYSIHWAFTQDQTYKQVLTDVLAHYFGDFMATVRGEVAILLDQLQAVDPDRLLGDIDVRLHVDGTPPEDAVSWRLDIANLVNEITLHYQYSWSRQAYTASTTVTDERSLAVYKTKRTREISLPGIRTQPHLDAWLAQFFARYSLLPATVSFPLRTIRGIGLLPSVYTPVTWKYGPSRDGLGWRHRMVKVLDHTVHFQGQQIRLRAFDTGLDWAPSTYTILTNALAETWYLSANDDGTWGLSATNPGLESTDEGMTWAWIRLTSPDSTDYYLQPSSATSWTISTSQPTGTGTTAPVLLTSRNATRWRLQITDAQEVFLTAEPAALPFGGIVAQTAVLGQFRLDFHVLG